MKSIGLIYLALGFCMLNCNQNSQPQPRNIKSLNTGDSMVTGTAPITPDGGDETLPMDSTAYNVDSIKNSK